MDGLNASPTKPRRTLRNSLTSIVHLQEILLLKQFILLISSKTFVSLCTLCGTKKLIRPLQQKQKPDGRTHPAFFCFRPYENKVKDE